jgi:hypothetical protein
LYLFWRPPFDAAAVVFKNLARLPQTTGKQDELQDSVARAPTRPANALEVANRIGRHQTAGKFMATVPLRKLIANLITWPDGRMLAVG